jgi:hypothetical protein
MKNKAKSASSLKTTANWNSWRTARESKPRTSYSSKGRTSKEKSRNFSKK